MFTFSRKCSPDFSFIRVHQIYLVCDVWDVHQKTGAGARASNWAAWATTIGLPRPRLDCTTACVASTGVTAGVTASTTFGLPRQRPPRTTISRITLPRPRSSSPLRLPPRLLVIALVAFFYIDLFQKKVCHHLCVCFSSKLS